MIKTDSLHQINNCLCTYIQNNNKSHKRNISTSFMRRPQLKQFYQDMENQIRMEHGKKQTKTKKNTLYQRKHRKINENKAKIISWDVTPQFQMIIGNDMVWQQNKKRKRSKTNLFHPVPLISDNKQNLRKKQDYEQECWKVLREKNRCSKKIMMDLLIRDKNCCEKGKQENSIMEGVKNTFYKKYRYPISYI